MNENGGPSDSMLNKWIVNRRPWGTWLAFRLTGEYREFDSWRDAFDHAYQRARRSTPVRTNP